MSDAPQPKSTKAQTSEGITSWVADHVWAPVKDNVLAPLSNVGVQALNAVHVTDGVNLVKHASNAAGLTEAKDTEKLSPFYVPKPTSFAQRAVQDLSSTAGSILLYTALAKGTSKLLGSGSSAFASGERVATSMAEEDTILNQSLTNVASVMRAGSKASLKLSQEQNALVVGATVYNAARDPENGETRTGNALGALTQFGIYRAANSKLSSSFSAESGIYSKLSNVVAPRIGIGLAAGLAQDLVSHTVSNSINERAFVPGLGERWQDGLGMNAAMNVILPSLLGGKAGDSLEAAGEGIKAIKAPRVETQLPAPLRVESAPSATEIRPGIPRLENANLKLGSPAIVKPGEYNVIGIAPELRGAAEQAMPEPLNVFSKSPDALGRALSNFAHTPFELDGKLYASVEAFYSSLKYTDEAKRSEIAPLYGTYAKSAGSGSHATTIEYGGQKMAAGSPEHHALLTRAVRAKLEQNPELLEEFVASQGRPIVHDTGHVSKKISSFPSEAFTGILTKLRDELSSLNTVAAPTEASKSHVETIEADGGKSDFVLRAQAMGNDGTVRSVSQAIDGIKDPTLIEHHNLSAYARAFEHSDVAVKKVLGGGSDSVVLGLVDGNTMKIGTRELPADAGRRPFDMPILESGSRSVDGYTIRFFTQPGAEPVSSTDLANFNRSLVGSGYYMREPFASQLGRLGQRILLLDPWAVEKTEVPAHETAH